MYNIAVYFYEFCSILTRPQGESKYKERVKICSDIVHQNISLLKISAGATRIKTCVSGLAMVLLACAQSLRGEGKLRNISYLDTF